MPASDTRKLAKGRNLRIEIANRQTRPIPRAWIRRAVEGTLATGRFRNAEISVAVVGDREMRQLNRAHLAHDYTTDVLSFPLSRDARAGELVGEIVVCWPVAQRAARAVGWAPRWELLLYVVHGTLHLLGYDDKTPTAQRQMQAAEDAVFRAMQLPVPPRGL